MRGRGECWWSYSSKEGPTLVHKLDGRQSCPLQQSWGCETEPYARGLKWSVSCCDGWQGAGWQGRPRLFLAGHCCFYASRDSAPALQRSSGNKLMVIDGELWMRYVNDHRRYVEELQADRQIVLAAVRTNGGALAYAADCLKADRQIVLAASGHVAQPASVAAAPADNAAAQTLIGLHQFLPPGSESDNTASEAPPAENTVLARRAENLQSNWSWRRWLSSKPTTSWRSYSSSYVHKLCRSASGQPLLLLTARSASVEPVPLIHGAQRLG
jgi:hypothetical protein